MGVKRMSMFSEEQQKVRQLIHKEEYDIATILCNEKLQYLENNNIESDNDFWFFYLRLAICYRRKKQYKKALSFVNKSSLYTKTQTETMECWWTLANCYYCLGNLKSAIKFYKKCQEYYKRNEYSRGYYVTSFNIAKINNDKDEVINIINNLNRTDTNGYLLDNAYALLCEIYIENNQIEVAYDLIHNIHSESVKNEIEYKLAKSEVKLCVL
jgi:tetratricopeptide (TPR) repeat protein